VFKAAYLNDHPSHLENNQSLRNSIGLAFIGDDFGVGRQEIACFGELPNSGRVIAILLESPGSRAPLLSSKANPPMNA
jgi:hypothetical protein